MKAQSAAITGALAVAGLFAAYLTWQRPETHANTEATVMDVNRSSIQAIRYEDARRTVEVVPDQEQAWIRHAEKPVPPKPPASAGADGGTVAAAVASSDPGGVPPPKVREFRGNETALNLVDRFAPLLAVRALGVLPKEKLDEVGLSDSQRVLEVVTRSGSRRFRISSDAPGATAPYVRDEADGNVYILQGTLVSDLEFGSSRLVDRRLHVFRDDEFDRVAVTADGKTRVLVKDGDRLAAAPGAGADDFATNWHARIWPLIGVEVLGRGEDPAAGAPVVQVRVDYRKGERAVGFIELGKAGNDVFARTEHTAGWVRLHGGTAQILDERTRVVSPQG